ncbi:hypothetical protein E2C01_039844 [Portunus trituberculatus]|uniref:Uncharacterized protein n=1 Tax=Portunus trituberculatus TaxID=210409 RepID=A0A5B7FP47_PORTR|nr:hypothetical protein [Portunus trituberculatus]
MSCPIDRELLDHQSSVHNKLPSYHRVHINIIISVTCHRPQHLTRGSFRRGTVLKRHCKGLTNHYLNKKNYREHNTKIQYAKQSTAWMRLGDWRDTTREDVG